MLNFSIDNRKFSLPVSWREVTVAQYLAIRTSKRIAESNDIVELISILTGLEYDFLFGLKLNAFNLDKIIANLEWFQDTPDFESLPLPATFNIGGKQLPITQDITMEGWGQKILFEQKIFKCQEETGDTFNVLDEALAIYFYHAYTGKVFNPDDLKEVLEAVRQTKILHAYPVAAFFLRNYMKYSRQRESRLTIKRMLKRFRRGLTILIGLES